MQKFTSGVLGHIFSHLKAKTFDSGRSRFTHDSTKQVALRSLIQKGT